MRILKTIPNPHQWWGQFPPKLRLTSQIRLLTSFGTGATLYITPLIFNGIGFSATQIGTGISAAALAGTIARLTCGTLLDKGSSYISPIRFTAVISLFADFFLLRATHFNSYLHGQILLGIATGLYWPAIELAVPASSKDFPSSIGFALARSADALGIGFGALTGTLLTSIQRIRSVYLVDIICMVLLLTILSKVKFNRQSEEFNKKNYNTYKESIIANSSHYRTSGIWPIVLVTIVSTLTIALFQSAMPLDLVRGGVERISLSETTISGIITIQLMLLIIFQWPIGRWLAEKNPRFGLKFCLCAFSIACLVLGISSFFRNGIILISIAQVPISLAIAAFLPSATEIIIKKSPYQVRGMAMAFFSQSFAITSLLAPLLAGLILDRTGTAVLIWLITSGICLASIPVIRKLDYLTI